MWSSATTLTGQGNDMTVIEIQRYHREWNT